MECCLEGNIQSGLRVFFFYFILDKFDLKTWVN